MFSNEQLQELIKGNIVGNTFPYDTKNEAEIEAHMKRLYYRMKRIPNVICEADWDHFGSGYASFVEFFCYRKEDVIINDDKEKYGILEYEKAGIILDVSRLAPVYIIGEGDRWETIRTATNEVIGGGYSSLPGHAKLSKVSEKFDLLVYQLQQALSEFNYEKLVENEMNQRLPFQTKIPTIYREPSEYMVLDAIFYWED